MPTAALLMRSSHSEGTHAVTAPVKLAAELHSHTHWTRCSRAGPPPVVSGGIRIPPESWRQEQQSTKLWSVKLSTPTHVRTLFVNGIRANRTRANASALLGDLAVTPTGYTTGAAHTIPWNDAESNGTVEFVYFQQVAPWQSQRCTIARVQGGHAITMAQPCYTFLGNMVKAVPGLPRNRSYGRSGCGGDPACNGIEGNPLGSGLPLYVENVPITTATATAGSAFTAEPGQFWYSKPEEKLFYYPRPADLKTARAASSRGGDARARTEMTAEVVVPAAESGLFTGVGLTDVSFDGISFMHSAWNGPNTGAGYVDLQDGYHFAPDGATVAAVPGGGINCANCTGIVVKRCTFAQLGGSAVAFAGAAHNCTVESTTIDDVGCSGIQIGNTDELANGNDTTLQSYGNTVTGSTISRAGQEFTGCCGIAAGFNKDLYLANNTISEMPYGAVSVGAGAAHPSYAANNEVAHNKIERWMLLMQDSGAVYMTGPQPGSSVHHNYFGNQGLSGLEPPPACDRPLEGKTCTVAEVEAVEDLWLIRIKGWKWNLTNCHNKSAAVATAGAPSSSSGSGRAASSHRHAYSSRRTAAAGGGAWCNQAGNMHGGAIYPDNGSADWDVFQNVFEDVVHWGFVWDTRKMRDMAFHSCYTDSPLYTNNAGKHNVTFTGNTFVNRSAGKAWPKAAIAIMRGAGAPSH